MIFTYAFDLYTWAERESTWSAVPYVGMATRCGQQKVMIFSAHVHVECKQRPFLAVFDRLIMLTTHSDA